MLYLEVGRSIYPSAHNVTEYFFPPFGVPPTQKVSLKKPNSQITFRRFDQNISVTKSLNFEISCEFRQNFLKMEFILPKILIHKEWRQTIWNYTFSDQHDKLRQNGWFFWQNFQQLFWCWIQQNFIGVKLSEFNKEIQCHFGHSWILCELGYRWQK